jgi:hypothetical protein
MSASQKPRSGSVRGSGGRGSGGHGAARLAARRGTVGVQNTLGEHAPKLRRRSALRISRWRIAKNLPNRVRSLRGYHGGSASFRLVCGGFLVNYTLHTGGFRRCLSDLLGCVCFAQRVTELVPCAPGDHKTRQDEIDQVRAKEVKHQEERAPYGLSAPARRRHPRG